MYVVSLWVSDTCVHKPEKDVGFPVAALTWALLSLLS